jgi:hypothetical protein
LIDLKLSKQKFIDISVLCYLEESIFKMTKRIISTLFFLLLATQTWTQTVTYNKAQKWNAKKDLFSIGGKVDDKLWIFYTDKKDAYIDIYDDEMQRKAIVKLNFMPDAPKQVKLLTKPQQALLLYSATINSKEFFYLARLDKDGKIIGRPKSIDTAFQNFFGNTKFDYYFMYASSNTKAGVLSYRIKDSKLELNLTIADDSLNIVHSSSHSLPIKSFYGLSQILLKDDGSVVLLATDLATNKNNEVAEAMIYHIMPEDKKHASVSAQQFNFGEVFTGNIFLKEDLVHKDLLHFAGLIKSKAETAEGIYHGTIDLTAATNTEITGLVARFDENTYPAVNNTTGRSGNFIIRDIVVKNDGGLVIISEEFERIVRSSYAGSGYYGWGYGSMTPNRYVEYIYGNILLNEVSNTGITSTANVSKWQHSIDDNGTYSSFAVINTGASIGFVFSDKHKGSSVYRSEVVQMNGRQDAQILMSEIKSLQNWVPRQGVQISAKSLIIPAIGSNKLQFVKISY